MEILEVDNESNENKNEIININDKNEEKSFNRLCHLQKLIKTESSLNEICKSNFKYNFLNTSFPSIIK